MSISSAAKALGISTEGVRQRVKRQKLQSMKGDDGRTYVLIDDENPNQQTPNGITNSVGNLYTDALRSQIEELQADKEHLREEAHRMQQIIMALSQKIPEPPQESVVLKELTGATQEVKEKTVRGITKWMRRFSR
jgi:DNA-directed RNA polymerase specialized sigma24 family protein